MYTEAQMFATGEPWWMPFDQWLDTDAGKDWLDEMAEIESIRQGWM